MGKTELLHRNIPQEIFQINPTSQKDKWLEFSGKFDKLNGQGPVLAFDYVPLAYDTIARGEKKAKKTKIKGEKWMIVICVSISFTAILHHSQAFTLLGVFDQVSSGR